MHFTEIGAQAESGPQSGFSGGTPGFGVVRIMGIQIVVCPGECAPGQGKARVPVHRFLQKANSAIQ